MSGISTTSSTAAITQTTSATCATLARGRAEWHPRRRRLPFPSRGEPVGTGVAQCLDPALRRRCAVGVCSGHRWETL